MALAVDRVMHRQDIRHEYDEHDRLGPRDQRGQRGEQKGQHNLDIKDADANDMKDSLEYARPRPIRVEVDIPGDQRSEQLSPRNAPNRTQTARTAGMTGTTGMMGGGHSRGTFHRQPVYGPPIGTYGTWVNVAAPLPSGMVPRMGGMQGIPGMHGIQGVQIVPGAPGTPVTPGAQGVTPFVPQAMPQGGSYALNARGYQGQAFLPAMMYMPLPHIAPRLAPPFIDRNKSASASRGNSRSPRVGASYGDGGYGGRGPREGSDRDELDERALAAHMGEMDLRDDDTDASETSDASEEDSASGTTSTDEELGEGKEEGAARGVGDEDSGSFSRSSRSPRVSGSSQSPTHLAANKKPCAFFLQHGSCAFGSKCKFSHPIELAPVVQYNSVGLPRRLGQPVCRYYVQTGRCSYGYTCKFDHPELQ